jgi:hypothetical protein
MYVCRIVHDDGRVQELAAESLPELQRMATRAVGTISTVGAGPMIAAILTARLVGWRDCPNLARVRCWVASTHEERTGSTSTTSGRASPCPGLCPLPRG